MPGEKLTPDQQEFWARWPGDKHIIYNEAQAERIAIERRNKALGIGKGA